jgi:cytochrome c biogenesis protein CcmG/thiol:disulfide interchange protein DsbE
MANENDGNLPEPTSGPKSARLPRWIIWLSLALLIIIPLADRLGLPSRRLKGKLAPDLVFHDTAGKSFKLSAFRGNTVLLNFWASWCGPCMEEMPSLRRLEAKYADRKFLILAINVEEPATEVQDLIHGDRLPKNLFFQPTAETIDAYDVHSIPMSFLLDRSGEMKKAYIGPRDWEGPSITREIEALLGSS